MHIRHIPSTIATAAGVLLLTFCVTTVRMAGNAAAAAAEDAEQPTVAGWAEKVWFRTVDTRFSLNAKLDTGATSASIHAPGFQEFQRDGKAWIAFVIVDEKGRTIDVHAQRKRTANIRRAGDRVRERPVIEMTVCVAGHTMSAEFTLADRETMDYPVLIGRNVLENRVLVDSGQTFIASERC